MLLLAGALGGGGGELWAGWCWLHLGVGLSGNGAGSKQLQATREALLTLSGLLFVPDCHSCCNDHRLQHPKQDCSFGRLWLVLGTRVLVLVLVQLKPVPSSKSALSASSVVSYSGFCYYA
jgi:hypothetical protein